MRGLPMGKPRCSRPGATLMRYMRCSSPWLSWAGLGLVGLGCIGLGCLCCTGMCWSVLVCAGGGLGCIGLGCAGLSCAVLDRAGLCCSALGWAVLGLIRLVCVCVEGGARPIVRPHRSLALSSVVLLLVRSSAVSLARSFSRCFALPLVLSSAGSFARSLARFSLSLLCSLLRSPPPQTLVQPFSTSFRA